MKKLIILNLSWQKNVNLSRYKQILRIMRISTFLVFFCSIVANAADGNSLKSSVSMRHRNVHLETVLNDIESQTDYQFSYNDNQIDVSRNVSVNVKNMPINQLLGQLFSDSQVKYEIEGTNIVLLAGTSNVNVANMAGTLQQSITITGRVIDGTGDPLPGVSIRIKGLAQGTATDGNGSYTLSVANENASLEFSYVGFVRQEIAVGSRRTINVTMIEDVRQMEEVVVIGYGSMKKENLTGSVAQVKGEVLENRPVLNVAQALQGQIANLNISPTTYGNDVSRNTMAGGAPGAPQSINIRGFSGLGSMPSPLLIIDGVQGGDLNSINMNDVESISVLKDAASSAIYGSSAPFGVIIINTKKGGKDKKPTITYNNNFAFATPIHIPKIANSYEWGKMFNEASDNAGAPRQFSDDLIQKMKDQCEGKLPPFAVQPLSTGDAWDAGAQHDNSDWFDFWLRDYSFNHQHNVGVSGGSEKSSYYLGLGFNDQNGIYNYAEEKYKQYRIRVNLSSDLTSWLTVNFRGNFSKSESSTPTNLRAQVTVANLALMWPNWARKNTLDNWHFSARVDEVQQGGRFEYTNDRANLTGEFILKPLPGWEITGNYTYNGNYEDNTYHYRTTYNILPSGTAVARTNNPNSVRQDYGKYVSNIINLFSTYEKQLDKHNFKLLAGFTQELYQNKSLQVSNNYLFNNDLPSFVLSYGDNKSITDGANELAIRGGFVRVNYNYEQKYLVEFNGRYDGSSRFLKDQRMKFYPGVSAAWVPSREGFWKPIESYVNSFKFRVSYGQLGDQSFVDNYYPFYPNMPSTISTNTNWFYSGGRDLYMGNPGLINRNLTWVTTSTLDFGADLAFFDNRLQASFDWYKRASDNYVGPAEVLPSLLGANQPQVNNTATETKGVELTVGWSDRALDNKLNYNVNLVFSDYQAVVTKYPATQQLIDGYYVGKKIGEIWGYKTEGLFQSEAEIASAPNQNKIPNGSNNWKPGDVRYKDVNGDNVIDWGNNTLENHGDRVVIGNNTPRYMYGISLGADYNGFDLSVFLQGIGKRDYWTISSSYVGIPGEGGEYNASVMENMLHDRWTPETPDGFFPRYYLNNQMLKNLQPSDRYLLSMAYLRFKNLQLGYTIPKNITNKINCERLRVFVSGENLATICKFKMFDPEFVTSNGDRQGGKVYPYQRTWSFGLNVTF